MASFFKYNYKISSDEELMIFISKGKEEAFNEIYKRYSKKMLFFFYSKLYKDQERANDFLQELFLKIIENPQYFDSSKSFSTWVYAVANNMCKNEYRKKDTITSGYDLDIILEKETSDYIDKQDTVLFNKELQNQLDNLEDSKRTTFVLRFQQHLSIKEISQIMECSEGTVKSRIFYSLKILSEKLTIFNPKL